MKSIVGQSEKSYSKNLYTAKGINGGGKKNRAQKISPQEMPGDKATEIVQTFYIPRVYFFSFDPDVIPCLFFTFRRPK